MRYQVFVVFVLMLLPTSTFGRSIVSAMTTITMMAVAAVMPVMGLLVVSCPCLATGCS